MLVCDVFIFIFMYLHASFLAFYPNDFTYNWAAPVGDLLKYKNTLIQFLDWIGLAPESACLTWIGLD